jgi:drug/metabolite transporter (DMT)-like permease
MIRQMLPIILPLFAALLYVIGALLVKRASDLGVGVWRMLVLSNFISAVLFQLLLPFGGVLPVRLLWQPALLGLLFLMAQAFNYFALQRGDVSVATPVLGLKILLVALFSTALLTQPVTVRLWFAAALSSFAIVLLNLTHRAKHHHVGNTIVLASLSAAAFALFDVLVQKWSPAWGAGRLLPAMFWFVAALTMALIPFLQGSLPPTPRPAWPWLASGCAIIGAQSMLFVLVIVLYRNATATNVIYSSRGLWSVAAVWAFGHWFANREQHLGRRVLGWRLIGAALMTAAIALVVTG